MFDPNHKAGEILESDTEPDWEELKCSCGWKVRSQDKEPEAFFQWHDEHVLDVNTPLRAGEEVLLPTMYIKTIIETNGERKIEVGTDNPDDLASVWVPEHWLDRIGPIPQ